MTGRTEAAQRRAGHRHRHCKLPQRRSGPPPVPETGQCICAGSVSLAKRATLRARPVLQASASGGTGAGTHGRNAAPAARCGLCARRVSRADMAAAGQWCPDQACTEVSVVRSRHVRKSPERRDRSRIDAYLPRLRRGPCRDHADRRLPVVLGVSILRGDGAAEAGRLLRLLFLRHRRLPADPAGRRLLRLSTSETSRRG